MFDSMFGKSFNSGKCKTLLRLATSRIKLLRNKRDIQLKQMKKEFVQLLQTNQEPSARIRVEHIFREQNVMAAYELIELFCELIVVRLPIIDSQRQCPIDLREAVASLIFAAPRCADLPELQQIRNLFTVKYGKEFVAGAAELRPDCGVNRLVIEKLSVRAPLGEVKLKLMKDIAQEQGFDWDASASESELLKAPEDLLEGPSRFLGASQMSLETPYDLPPVHEPAVEQSHTYARGDSKISISERQDSSMMDEKQFIPFVRVTSASTSANTHSQKAMHDEPLHTPPATSASKPTNYKDDNDQLPHVTTNSSTSKREESFKDVVAAAQAAAESAERAASAARAAAALVRLESSRMPEKVRAEEDSSSESDDEGDLGNRQSIVSESATEDYGQQRVGERPFFDNDDDESNRTQTIFTKYQSSWKLCNDGSYSKARSEHYVKVRPEYDDDDDESKQQQYLSEESRYDVRAASSMKSRVAENSRADPVFDSSSGLDEKQYEDLSASKGQPPQRRPPGLPGDARAMNRSQHVHPKLPDYDDLAVRFEALRSSKR